MRARLVWTSSSSAQIQRIPVAVIRCQAVALRTFTNAPALASRQAAASADRNDDEHNAREKNTEEGAMSRRLAAMAADSIESGGSSAAKNVEAAGFSEELKKQLASRITDSAFRNQNQRTFAEAEMPVCLHSSTPGLFCSFSQHIVLSRQRYTRSRDSPAMDGHRVTPRLLSTNA